MAQARQSGTPSIDEDTEHQPHSPALERGELMVTAREEALSGALIGIVDSIHTGVRSLREEIQRVSLSPSGSRVSVPASLSAQNRPTTPLDWESLPVVRPKTSAQFAQLRARFEKPSPLPRTTLPKADPEPDWQARFERLEQFVYRALGGLNGERSPRRARNHRRSHQSRRYPESDVTTRSEWEASSGEEEDELEPISRRTQSSRLGGRSTGSQRSGQHSRHCPPAVSTCPPMVRVPPPTAADLDAEFDLSRTRQKWSDADLNTVDLVHASTRLPDFDWASPEGWFESLELFFGQANIQGERTRYFNALSRLPKEVWSRVKHYLHPDKVPDGKRYTALKIQVLRHFGKSEQTRCVQLLKLRSLGSSSPHDLLSEVRDLIPATHGHSQCPGCGLQYELAPCPLAYAQFRLKLPPAIQRELPRRPRSWDEVGDILVEVWEDHYGLNQERSVNAALSGNSKARKDEKLREAAERSAEQAQDTGEEPDEFSVAAARTSSTSLKINDEPVLCYWHRKFGDKARECARGCGWNERQSGGKSAGFKKRKGSKKSGNGGAGRT